MIPARLSHTENRSPDTKKKRKTIQAAGERGRNLISETCLYKGNVLPVMNWLLQRVKAIEAKPGVKKRTVVSKENIVRVHILAFEAGIPVAGPKDLYDRLRDIGDRGAMSRSFKKFAPAMRKACFDLSKHLEEVVLEAGAEPFHLRSNGVMAMGPSKDYIRSTTATAMLATGSGHITINIEQTPLENTLAIVSVQKYMTSKDEKTRDLALSVLARLDEKTIFRVAMRHGLRRGEEFLWSGLPMRIWDTSPSCLK